ncbi:MAG TPA: hypothetical protein VJO32_06155 [Ktedonobacteraceae bacterium]|nr:hypothetical protein [Ktedonobacteraceae bacterium]
MNSSTVQYVGFIVAALILTWAVIEINRRYSRRRKTDVRSLNTWVHLDTAQPDAPEESLPASDASAEPADSNEQNLQTRARQNGHYSESKKPL